MKKIVVFFTVIGVIARANAADWLERTGDILQFAVPAYAFGMTMHEADWDGAWRFGGAYGATILTSTALKQIVFKERPNKVNSDSFPSGHTASAFSGATFIHRRYGWRRAVVPYVLASITGISRVSSRWHDVSDVLAGATIAGLYSWILADKRWPVIFSAGTDGARLDFHARF